MFIGRITADMTDEDLYTYFSQYGEVTDVYFPKPCRGFAFVTFSNAEAAQKLALEDHIIKVSQRQGGGWGWARPSTGFFVIEDQQYFFLMLKGKDITAIHSSVTICKQ